MSQFERISEDCARKRSPGRAPGLEIFRFTDLVTSRPEIDIRIVLEPLISHHISLHDESGQKADIFRYVSDVVMADRKMRRWRLEDKQTVINTLTAKADGM